jgi:hypothetical protein
MMDGRGGAPPRVRISLLVRLDGQDIVSGKVSEMGWSHRVEF